MVPGIAPSMTRQMVQTVGQRKEDRERQHGNINAQNGRTQRQLPFDPVRTKFYFAGEREPGPSSQGPQGSPPSSTPHVLAPLQQRAPALHFAQPPQFSPSQFSPPPPPPTTASPPVPSQQHYQPQGYSLPPIRETYQRPRPELQVQSNLLPPLHLEPQEQPVPQPTPLSKVQKGKQREESIQQQPQPPPQPPGEEEEEPEPGPSTDDKGKGVEQPAQEVLEDGIAPGIDEYQTTVYKLIEEFHRVDKYGQYIMPGRAKPILYTNRRCPWAHRVHIALAELEIEYDEHTVDLDKPRTPQFLKVNPRGKVPAWSYEHTTLIESDIISSYLADRYQSHLLLPSNAPGGALQRARVSQFANSFFTRFQHVIGKLFSAITDDERAKIVEEAVSGLQAELENQLDGADPFFGGSKKLTQAEVLTASFAIRLNSLVKKTNIYPAQLWPTIEKRAPRFAKWVKAVSAHPSVTGSYDEKLVIEQARKRLATEQAAAANKKQPRAKK